MAKMVALFLMISLLLCSTLAFGARPEPAFPQENPVTSGHEKVEAEHVEGFEESCEGVGEEECLTRRTLAAHIDYIYTQKQKP
ncbi:phytosulfokines 3-like [Rhodamnia argentea]|uniref:Phytosulfokine n=1 Tax=Rhodamnia argentea TaxID=178133 RepID=A0A8B8PBD6_9MYRT|nr:phytosulfokines 3-like [Rhodamnia argentea]